MLHWVGFERRDAALLILLKRWHFVFHFSVHLLSVVSSFRVAHNVSAAEPVLMGVDACYGSVALLAGCFIYFLSTSISLTLSKNTRQLGCLSSYANDRYFLLLDRYFIF